MSGHNVISNTWTWKCLYTLIQKLKLKPISQQKCMMVVLYNPCILWLLWSCYSISEMPIWKGKKKHGVRGDEITKRIEMSGLIILTCVICLTFRTDAFQKLCQFNMPHEGICGWDTKH